MSSVATGLVLIPGVVTLLVFFVFTYLYEQSRQAYFRAWQFAWAAYTLYYGLEAIGYFQGTSATLFFLSSLLMVAMAICIFVSTRLMKEPFQLKWYDVALSVAGVGLAYWNLRVNIRSGVFTGGKSLLPHYHLGVGLAAILLYCSLHFYFYSHRKNSLAFRFLAFSLALWALLMGAGQIHSPFVDPLGRLGDFLGPIPQMLLAIAMVMVLFENERNAVQENALAFSTLGVDPTRVHDVRELVPSMASILERLVAPLPKRRAILYISQQWRAVLPSVERGFSPELLDKLENHSAGEFISDLAYRRGGFFAFRHMSELAEPLPAFAGERFEQFKKLLAEEDIRHLTAVSLQTREHNFGVILFPHAERRMFGSSNLRLLIGLALQIGLTLENYVVMH